MPSLSYKDTSTRLAEIASTTNATEFVYDLLRIFGDVTETRIRRIKEGTGNMAKDGKTVLAKFGKPFRVVAYRSAAPDGLAQEMELLKNDKKVMKQAPRLLMVSDGRKVVAHDPKEAEDYENDISALWKDFDFFMPLAGVEKFRNIEENEADVYQPRQ